jgi:anti-anti-sigma factor
MLQAPRLHVSEDSEARVVRFPDQAILDDATIQEIGEELSQVVEAEGRSKIVLDFSSVCYLSSAALGKLISLNKHMRARGRTLKLARVPPDIYEVFVVTKLDRLFEIEQDGMSARKAS